MHFEVSMSTILSLISSRYRRFKTILHRRQSPFCLAWWGHEQSRTINISPLQYRCCHFQPWMERTKALRAKNGLYSKFRSALAMLLASQSVVHRSWACQPTLPMDQLCKRSWRIIDAIAQVPSIVTLLSLGNALLCFCVRICSCSPTCFGQVWVCSILTSTQP